MTIEDRMKVAFEKAKPVRQKQDKTFLDGEFYAVVFFPKIKGLGKAQLFKHGLVETLSTTPEAAIIKFMDRGIKDERETWVDYRNSGWKVRKILVSDSGQVKSMKKYHV